MPPYHGFSGALLRIKQGEQWRRRRWKPNSFIFLQGARSGYTSFIAIHTDDGLLAPWTPSRCDLLEPDWCVYHHE